MGGIVKKRKKGRRFTFSTSQQSSQHRSTEMEPEDLSVYVRRAEKQVIPIIKERQLGPGAAQFLLAQQTQVLVTGDPRLTVESGMVIANRVLALWQEGYYTPGPAYPYTLEETLQELQEGPKAKENYEAFFQPFTSINNERPRGMGEVAECMSCNDRARLWFLPNPIQLCRRKRSNLLGGSSQDEYAKGFAPRNLPFSVRFCKHLVIWEDRRNEARSSSS